MQTNIATNYKSSNNHENISKKNNGTVNNSCGNLSKLINDETKQQLVLKDSHSGFLQTARSQNNSEVEEKTNLTASLNAFIDKDATKNNKNILSTLDVNKIKVIVNNNKWERYGCDVNVQKLLNLLSSAIQQKLTVIISTHEAFVVPYYGTDDYGFHTFILGQTEASTLIIDLSNKNHRPIEILMAGTEFFSKAFKPIIQNALVVIRSANKITITMQLRNNLPEFRLIPSQDYVESNLKNDIFYLTVPYYTEKYKPSFLSNKCWSNSYRLSIFEFFSLLNNQKLWHNLVKNYNNLPIDRLGLEDKNIQDKLIKKLEDICS